MKSLWDDKAASQFTDELGLRVYTSQLLGQDPDLVLHGGGNTSVKLTENNILGESVDLLYVKGSGWDLATIDRPGFSPVDLQSLIKLADLECLSDPQMVNELKTHMTIASAPTPSVEAILHAILPYKYVDHTHADAVVTITNTPSGMQRIKEVYGRSVVIIPYIMPGFDLARLCAAEFNKQKTEQTIGMVLMNHGIFSFGETARESYERMIELVGMAEDYLRQNRAHQPFEYSLTTKLNVDTEKLVRLRKDISGLAGKPVILTTSNSSGIEKFVKNKQLSIISQQGPATPDHVIRTKRLPLVGLSLDDYTEQYKTYFKKYSNNKQQELSMLDPAPRVILDDALGMVTVGNTIKDANIVRDIYMHTMKIILNAEALESYQALPANDIFDVEYWDLEQAKLKKTGSPPVFQGEVVLITGAAAGIGKACVKAFLNKGAAVIGLDVNNRVENLFSDAAYLGITCNLCNENEIDQAIQKGLTKFGGIDMAVLNAGIFPASAQISDIDMQKWKETLDINLNANVYLLKQLHAILKFAPNYGRIVFMGSKNVPAPGPGASAYSVSKAALTQLMRVAALEWGKDGIRVNELHPNAVFDTDIWTDDILKARADSYGLTIEQYKKRNVISTEITSHDVAELSTLLCSPGFAKTTAAQIPIDGGDERVI